MVDIKIITQVLRINGLGEMSHTQEVERILNALHLSDTDKQETLQALKGLGWVQDYTGTIPTNVAVYSPMMPNIMPSSVPVPPPVHDKSKVLQKIILQVILLAVLLGGGFAVYAYSDAINQFFRGTSKYTEANLASKLLAQASTITSSTYTGSVEMNVTARDQDAKPFVTRLSTAPEERQKYLNDYTRAQDLQTILSTLNFRCGPYTVGKTCPSTLFSALQGTYSSNKISTTDPVTHAPYQYVLTEGGKNFALTVTFDTNDAISAVRQYGYSATSTPITGKTVTFTKDSRQYLFLSQEPPKPALVSYASMLKDLPADAKASVAVQAKTSSIGKDSSSWVFNFDASGSFGDLTYKVNADAIKKDMAYYFKLNNIPNFFGSTISTIKGQWIKIPITDATSTDASIGGDPIHYAVDSVPQAEKTYKEKRANIVAFLTLATNLADEEKLVAFKHEPTREKVGDQTYTRYDLTLKKTAIVPFYNRLADAVLHDDRFKDFRSFVDQGLIEYLQSPEFAEVYDYSDANTFFSVWVDGQGFPAIIEERLRVVPPDEAIALKDKQINIVFKLTLTDINKPVSIEAPSGARTYDEIQQQVASAEYMGQNGSAYVQSAMQSLASEIMFYTPYTNNKKTYGNTPFPLGSCSAMSDTIFSNSRVLERLKQATNNNISIATCVAKGIRGNVTSWAASAPIPDGSGYSWCVSTNDYSAKQIKGAIKSDKC